MNSKKLFLLGLGIVTCAELSFADESAGAAPAANKPATENSYERAVQLEDAGQIEAALSQYELAAKSKPGDAMSIMGEARCYSQLGLQGRALQLLQQLAVAHPQDEKIWLNLAAVSLGAGDLQQSVQAVSNALSIEPNSYAGTRILTEISMRDAQLETAERLSFKLIDLAPENSEGYLLLAHCSRKLHKSPEEFALIIELAQLNLPKNSEMFLSLGKLCRQAGLSTTKVDEYPLRDYWYSLAQICTKTAVQANPSSVPARIELAKIMKHNHHYVEAMKELQEAQRLSPHDAQVAALIKSVRAASSNDLAARLKLWLLSLEGAKQ